MNSSVKIWIIAKRKDAPSDSVILQNILDFIDDFFDIPHQIVEINDITRGKIPAIDLTIDKPEALKYVMKILNKAFDFLWNEVIANEKQYETFIADCSLKNRIPAEENFITFQACILNFEVSNEILFNINRIYPKLFVFINIEEIADGFILFFNEPFDMDAFIQRPDQAQLGEKWITAHGFKLPPDFYKNQNAYLMKMIKE